MKAGVISVTCKKCGKRNPVKMGYKNLPAPRCPDCGTLYFSKRDSKSK